MTIQDILDHADELAARFENYEPEPDDERPVDEYLLERATLARARSERQIVDALTAARTKRVSWTRIGELLGTSAQAARYWATNLERADALLLGRVTYEMMEEAWRKPATGAWPDWMDHSDIAFAQTIDGAKKYVRVGHPEPGRLELGTRPG